ncbi:MAG: hypothetical protein D6689_02620 [Deltaproteobacteria bacterium]|nr:MAG: hypothetical protein D6689_02620 [Deltaproteobacteria bacterium]
MRTFVSAAAAVVALAWASGTARAQDDKGAFGLGLVLGEPTGISAKLYLSNDTAVDAAVGGAVVGKGIQAHADFLWHPWVVVNEDAFVLPAYIGLGARVLQHDREAEDDVHIGARFAVGALFDFREIPLDVFVEVALIPEFASGGGDHGGFGVALNAGAGARYYF